MRTIKAKFNDLLVEYLKAMVDKDPDRRPSLEILRKVFKTIRNMYKKAFDLTPRGREEIFNEISDFTEELRQFAYPADTKRLFGLKLDLKLQDEKAIEINKYLDENNVTPRTKITQGQKDQIKEIREDVVKSTMNYFKREVEKEISSDAGKVIDEKVKSLTEHFQKIEKKHTQKPEGSDSVVSSGKRTIRLI